MSEINAAENAIATESAPVVDAPDSSVDATESDPVETVVEGTEDSHPETTETDGSEPLGEKGQKEVITLRKRAQNAEALIDYYKNLVAQQQNPVQPQAQQQPTQLIPPKEEDYDTWDAWSAATSKYNIEVAKTEIRQEFQQQSMRGAQIQAETKWIERLNKEAEYHTICGITHQGIRGRSQDSLVSGQQQGGSSQNSKSFASIRSEGVWEDRGKDCGYSTTGATEKGIASSETNQDRDTHWHSGGGRE